MLWECNVTPVGCVCQEGNTICGIPSNDGLGAYPGSRFSTTEGLERVGKVGSHLSGEKTVHGGLKPAFPCKGLRGAEAPLFHGGAGGNGADRSNGAAGGSGAGTEAEPLPKESFWAVATTLRLKPTLIVRHLRHRRSGALVRIVIFSSSCEAPGLRVLAPDASGFAESDDFWFVVQRHGNVDVLKKMAWGDA